MPGLGDQLPLRHRQGRPTLQATSRGPQSLCPALHSGRGLSPSLLRGPVPRNARIGSAHGPPGRELAARPASAEPPGARASSRPPCGEASLPSPATAQDRLSLGAPQAPSAAPASPLALAGTGSKAASLPRHGRNWLK